MKAGAGAHRKGCLLATSLVALVTVLPAIPGSTGPSLRDLYRQPSLRQLEISPSGEHLASLVRQRGRYRVLVRRRDHPHQVTAFKRASGIRRIAWIDDQHLVILLGQSMLPTYHVVTLADGTGLTTREEQIRVRGRFVSLLPNLGEEVLWAVPRICGTALPPSATGACSSKRMTSKRCPTPSVSPRTGAI